MEPWIPSELKADGPKYLAIVEALQRAIDQGRLEPGARLLPQRELADRLGLSVGTVSKAYAQAEQLGLVVGRVGSGTFVRSAGGAETALDDERSPQVSLGLNVPPPGHHVEALLRAFAQLSAP
jgi:DNA-binding GntR family transcriptional regulator